MTFGAGILLGSALGATAGYVAGRLLVAGASGLSSVAGAASGLVRRMAVLGLGFWLASRLGTPAILAAAAASLAAYVLVIGSAVRVRHGR